MGGDGIASGLALCVTEAGSPKLFFSKARGIGLITIDYGQAGDLSKRLNLERKDEFNAVETGFNDMMTELTALV